MTLALPKTGLGTAEPLAATYEAPSFLVGYSLGGTACLYAARELPSVRGVATIGGIENAERIFTSTRHPKGFVSLRQADHLLSRPADAEYAGPLVGAWARALMPAPGEPEIRTNRQVAARIGRDHYTVQMRAGRHAMTADEPASVGGKDLGGSPYDYLLAALGAPRGRSQKIDRIERVLAIEGDLTHEQRDRLVEIADKCSVHKTLTTPTVVETRLPMIPA